MGFKNEPRKTVEVPVRIFGTDHDGRPFSENLATVDVSVHGAKLRGLKAKLQAEEIVGLSYGKNRSHFRVKWTGTPGTPTEGLIGLLNINPSKPFWDFPLPALDSESAEATLGGERRRWPRVKCSVSLELHPSEQTVIWGKASDISQGGCFVEMSIPLPIDASFDIALWLGDSKLYLRGQVVSLQPGFGNGVGFIDLAPADQERLRQFIETITHPKAPALPSPKFRRVAPIRRCARPPAAGGWARRERPRPGRPMTPRHEKPHREPVPAASRPPICQIRCAAGF